MAEHARDISDQAGYYISEATKAVDEKADEIKEELDDRREERKEKNAVRTDAFIAFMSDPSLAKHGRLMRAFPALRENFKERIVREAGEDFRNQIEEFFENRFKKVD